jgi:hypothetical protein
MTFFIFNSPHLRILSMTSSAYEHGKLHMPGTGRGDSARTLAEVRIEAAPRVDSLNHKHLQSAIILLMSFRSTITYAISLANSES